MDRDKLAVFSRAGWSAESGAQEWLERFSANVKAKADNLGVQVEALAECTSSVEQELQNTFNNFRLLSNTQFIENRVYEEDETLNPKQSAAEEQRRPENYEGDIVPRYKEAVVMAWNAHEHASKSSRIRATRHKLLPLIIGTEECMRDPYCGLTDPTKRRSFAETQDYDSEAEKDGADMAAEMVAGGVILEGEWSGTDSDFHEEQKDNREPAVSAALDFKAMLEAALRGPYVPCDDDSIADFNIYGRLDQLSPLSMTTVFDKSPRTGLGDNNNEVDVPSAASGHLLKVGGEDSVHAIGSTSNNEKQEVSNPVAPIQHQEIANSGYLSSYASRPTVSDELFLPHIPVSKVRPLKNSLISAGQLPRPNASNKHVDTGIRYSAKMWDLFETPHTEVRTGAAANEGLFDNDNDIDERLGLQQRNVLSDIEKEPVAYAEDEKAAFNDILGRIAQEADPQVSSYFTEAKTEDPTGAVKRESRVISSVALPRQSDMNSDDDSSSWSSGSEKPKRDSENAKGGVDFTTSDKSSDLATNAADSRSGDEEPFVQAMKPVDHDSSSSLRSPGKSSSNSDTEKPASNSKALEKCSVTEDVNKAVAARTSNTSGRFKSLFDDDDDEDNMFGSPKLSIASNSGSNVRNQQTAFPLNEAFRNTTLSTLLFGDEDEDVDEDALFGPLGTTQKIAKPNASGMQPLKAENRSEDTVKASLFDD